MQYNQFEESEQPNMTTNEHLEESKKYAKPEPQHDAKLMSPRTTDQHNHLLFHVLLTTSHFAHDPNNQVEKVRIVGSYDSLKHAKTAAHRCLFEAGYQREWFEQYEVDPQYFEKNDVAQRDGLEVLATATNGATFRVRIVTSPNVGKFTSPFDDGRIPDALYHVLQTHVSYKEDESGEVRDTDVKATFATYNEARSYASRVLLSPEKDVTRDSFAEYDEAGPGERDCGYGENVIVHAVGDNGQNYLISVVQGQELESVRLAEAAMRIR
ncbi:hypothetical protein H2198_000121 [Neophaeococcomyces mojaviensis]|uniref:Uncharacterized protein n=1 Tax=Neophaeococcomyces mojaviensis TaxID=3383035 RepID=A0ACC3AL74_9EURO|nr:hypothetical protein H2198_000121 [Knufia sp. JES_112]